MSENPQTFIAIAGIVGTIVGSLGGAALGAVLGAKLSRRNQREIQASHIRFQRRLAEQNSDLLKKLNTQQIEKMDKFGKMMNSRLATHGGTLANAIRERKPLEWPQEEG